MKFKMNNSDWEIKEISNAEMNVLVPSDKQETFTHGTTQYDCNTIFINEDTPNKKKTLYHELTHCFMYEYGHSQWNKEFDNEDVCEIMASSHDIIHEIVEEYFSRVEIEEFSRKYSCKSDTEILKLLQEEQKFGKDEGWKEVQW